VYFCFRGLNRALLITLASGTKVSFLVHNECHLGDYLEAKLGVRKDEGN
jgi:hypothetical protein